jgi:hypothetical protein
MQPHKSAEPERGTKQQPERCEQDDGEPAIGRGLELRPALQSFALDPEHRLAAQRAENSLVAFGGFEMVMRHCGLRLFSAVMEYGGAVMLTTF